MTATVAAVTMHSTTDLSANLAKAAGFIAEAAAKGAQFVLLPEMFSVYGLPSYTDYAEQEAGKGGRALAMMAEQAQRFGLSVAGTLPERLAPSPLLPDDDGSVGGKGKVYNTLFVVDAAGKIAGRYRKTHLFNLVAADGSPRYRESDTFVPGSTLATMTLAGFHTALSTCYDIRFSKLYHKLSETRPLDLILAPSAFTAATGKAHWHTLLKSRAIEFQSYVIAANQTGSHGKDKASYGHSLIVDPWGEVLADTGAKEGVAVADISLERLAEVRAMLPAYANQRRDLC